MATKLKTIVTRALQIREKAGFTTETITKKRYKMAYIPDAIKQAAKELKGTEKPKRTKRVVKTKAIVKKAAVVVVPLKRTKRVVKTKAIKGKVAKSKFSIPRTLPTEISYETGYRAYSGISFSPEKRAKSTQEDFANSLNNFAEELEAVIKTKDQYIQARAEFIRYKAGYKTKYLAWLSALGRTLSSMITGPANFPIRKNEKANNVEHNRLNELVDYKDFQKKIISRVKANVTAEVKADESWVVVRTEVLNKVGSIIAIKTGKMGGYDVRLFVSGLTGFLQRLAKNGRVQDYNRAIDLIEETEAKYNVKVFAANNPIRTRIHEKEVIPADVEKVVLYDKNDIRIINNKEAERIQIHFNGKPSAKIISELKSHAWKWSPSNMAWQRKNTSDAAYYLRKFFIPEYITPTNN